MSSRRSRNRAAVVLSVVAAAAMLWAATATAAKPPRKVRASLGSTRAEYTITQQGRVAGTESILRTDYNDNTVTFGVHHHFEPGANTTMDEHLEFTVVEESYFPLGYRMTKEIDQGEAKLNIETSIEMFANVAVMKTTSGGSEGTRRIVLPTGAAFVETGTIYSYEQFLFWYDSNLGGRQTFNAMDVSNGKLESVVFQQIARDTVSVGGADTPVDVYKLERAQFEVTLYVDDKGRMVRVEQNFMVWDLEDWSHESVKDE